MFVVTKYPWKTIDFLHAYSLRVGSDDPPTLFQRRNSNRKRTKQLEPNRRTKPTLFRVRENVPRIEKIRSKGDKAGEYYKTFDKGKAEGEVIARKFVPYNKGKWRFRNCLKCV